MMTTSVSEARASWQQVLRLCGPVQETLAHTPIEVGRTLAIFGAGPYGRVVLRALRAAGMSVACFYDNSAVKQGTVIDGVPVRAPDDFSTVDTVVIGARHAAPALRAQLAARGQRSVSFDAYFVVSALAGLERLRGAILGDDRSRVVLDGVLQAMLTGDARHCAAVMEPDQYFALPSFTGAGANHFIDAGAYVGDTVEKFIWASSGVFARIHAFEPGPAQRRALQARVARLTTEWALSPEQITCVPAGLGAVSGTASANTDGHLTSTALGDAPGGETVQVLALDDYLAGRPATFIKADVEGMERDLLHGAQNTIRTFRPRLALSVYHEPDHLVALAEDARRLVPEYRIALRHHTTVQMETVLYCWIED